ncbi:hypothetical protein ILUMI_02476 [Ignelater luminosus]|uniref:Uncharacterized protein n=1 Tax=Ignelater luminosus TaxID=2038154 RepID=A0A8K0DI12_IGNLU|nr:hypothetical protein ILUMI_02476 [Ignelater luminosus]
MPDKKLFEAVNKNVNKFEVRLENYIVPSLQTNKLNRIRDNEQNDVKNSTTEENKNNEPEKKRASKTADDETPEERAIRIRNEIVSRYSVFADRQVKEPPRLCMWFYMAEKDVEDLLNITTTEDIRKTIDDKMESEYPKGISRVLAIELMYSVVRFCQKCSFNLAQSGALLSIFYLVHEYFLSSLHTSAENIYNFFKEYMLLHCFECPPDSMKLFSYKESTHIVRYFCSLYLRNLPLIRLLTLPSFGFVLNYEIPPDPFEEMGKKGKNGKGKKKK